MAKPRAKARPAQPATKRPSPAAKAKTARPGLSPHLFLNPLGNFSNGSSSFSFGVLRPQFNGRQNTAEEFGRLKLHPVNAPAPGQKFSPTCRFDVLLPTPAPDEWLDPQRLLAAFDSSALKWKNGILAYATFRFERAPRLHSMFEEVRRFAAERLLPRQVAVIIMQHAPHLVGSRNLPHCHLLVPIREITAFSGGFGAYDELLMRDEAQQLIWDNWLEFSRP
ncbi:MAG TPA: hypothetical protein VGB04_11100 [Allosphingosinicella sp.]|jgi:hypothetical protein